MNHLDAIELAKAFQDSAMIAQHHYLMASTHIAAILNVVHPGTAHGLAHLTATVVPSYISPLFIRQTVFLAGSMVP